MGFSLTGSHVVFFIASLIAAGAVSGVFIAVSMNVGSSLSERGDRVQEQLDTDFKIINDPDNIPTQGTNYVFYIKNIGGRKIVTNNNEFQAFIDGEILTSSQYSFGNSSIQPGEVAWLLISTSAINSGDKTLRIVGPQAIEDEFDFTV